MKFNELKNEVKKLALETVRAEQDNYFEAVIFNNKVAGLKAILDKFLGLPVFPSQNKLSLQIEKAISSYGGIQPGQTLYWKQEGSIVIAMLWPWQDKIHTTVKIIHRE
jgi:hypothetical protein